MEQKKQHNYWGDYDIPTNSHQAGKTIDFHIDTMTFTGNCEDIVSLCEYIFSGNEYAVLDYIRNYNGNICKYKAYNFNNSIIIEYSDVREIFGIYDRWLRLTLNGSYLETMSFLSQVRILTNLINVYNLKPTRIDLALDDYKKVLNTSQIWEHSESIIGFKKKQIVKSGNIDLEDNELNTTIYFGSSRKKLRIYNTKQKHNYDAFRFEIQLRENYALLFAKGIVSTSLHYEFSEDYESLLTSEILEDFIGLFDFRQRIDKNLERCPRLIFWSDFLNYINIKYVKKSLPKVQITIENKLDWVKRQVAKTITMINLAMSPEQFDIYLNGLFNNAIDRFKSHDKLWLNQFINYYKTS